MRRLGVQLGHSKPVTSMAFSSDGRFVLTGSEDKTALLWDAETGRELQRFKGHSDQVTSVAFSPDGRYVLTGSDDRTARLWNAISGQEMRQLVGHTGRVTSVAFSPNGRYLLTAGDDTARLWNASTGKEMRFFAGHCGAIHSAAFSPNGRGVLTGCSDSTARLWNATNGREIQKFGDPYGGYSSVSYSTASYSDSIRSTSVTSVAFSPNGRYVLTVSGSWGRVALLFARRAGLAESDDTGARVWDAASGKEVRRFKGNFKVDSAAFSRDGQFFLTGSDDGVARLWDVGSGNELRRFQDPNQNQTAAMQYGDRNAYSCFPRSCVTLAVFSPDGRYVLTGDNSQRLTLGKRTDTDAILLWDARNGREVRRFEGHSDGLSSVAFSPNGELHGDRKL